MKLLLIKSTQEYETLHYITTADHVSILMVMDAKSNICDL